jgi:arginase family enzyme
LGEDEVFSQPLLFPYPSKGEGLGEDFVLSQRLPHVTDLAGVGFAIAGVPFDTGATFRVGARFGPEGIRNNSLLLAANIVYEFISLIALRRA